MSDTNWEIQLAAGMEEVDAQQWDLLAGADYPFTRHNFLLGLERTGCTSGDSGWEPLHLLLRRDDELVAAVPNYLKNHSWGEYVFDWSWADAWRSNGLQYYPKLVSAIPFTPATGPRLLINDKTDAEQVRRHLLQGIEAFAGERDISSWHLLFPTPDVSDAFAELGCHQRTACQFHWFNRDYQDFDGFLADCASRKRKNLRRERRRVSEQGITLQTLTGEQAEPAHWEQFYSFYQMTYAKRSGHGGYLSREFFTEVVPALGSQAILVLAHHRGQAVAGALYFRSADTLFGRYWGCLQEFDMLHFEACYYRGIEYCIEQGIARFDPGAQGEHKIQRGFRPVITRSNHWIADPRFAAAIEDFTRREARHTEAYRQDAASLLPFREDVPGPDPALHWGV